MIFDRLVRLLLPRQDRFFVMLEAIAGKITEATALFSELTTATGRAQLEAIAARLKPIEVEADELCHQVYEELDKTFVTPIDREDLGQLTKVLDDVIDGMEHSAAFAALFRFEQLTEPMRQMVRITANTANELVRAVSYLRKFSDPESIRGSTVAVHTLENEADVVYRKAIEALLATAPTPASWCARRTCSSRWRRVWTPVRTRWT